MGRGRFSERVESNWEVSLIYIIHPYMGIVTIARAGPESTQNLSGHVPSSGHPLSIQHREWVCAAASGVSNAPWWAWQSRRAILTDSSTFLRVHLDGRLLMDLQPGHPDRKVRAETKKHRESGVLCGIEAKQMEHDHYTSPFGQRSG